MQAQLCEPAPERLLATLGSGTGLRAADLGCGPLGWLRILARRVGSADEVVGTEIGDETAEQARFTVRTEGLASVRIVVDDVFDSQLPEHSFDLVHSRLMLGPIGRAEEQLASYLHLLKPGGWLVLEDLDIASYRFNPSGPGNERLLEMVVEWGEARGRNASMGRKIRTLPRPDSEKPAITAEVLVLPPGPVYRAYSVVLATTLRAALAKEYGAEEVERLLVRAEEELDDHELWCTSFMLIQGVARV